MGAQDISHSAVIRELVTRPLADIAQELDALRQANSNFAAELATLRPEHTLYQNENRVFRAAVKFLMQEGGFLQPVPKMPPRITSLPPEVLVRIFRATVLPRHECDPSAVMGLASPWPSELRFRKNLVLVCRTFSGPATEALYEDIVIYRMGQIPSLASTLSSKTGCELGALIRHIRLVSCVIWAPCADVVREDIMGILRHCTALRSFSFLPHPNFPTANSPHQEDILLAWDGFNPDWVLHDHTDEMGLVLQEKLRSGLRELDISMMLDHAQIVELHALLSAASQLQTLRLGPASFSFEVNLYSLPQLELSRLEKLQIKGDCASFSEYVALRWVLPSLTSFTAMSCKDLPCKLLEVHGRRLTHLHIFHHIYDSIPTWFHVLEHPLPTWCPVLEHLVLPPGCLPYLLEIPRWPTLRFLDDWDWDWRIRDPEGVESEAAEAVASGRMPALACVRHLTIGKHAWRRSPAMVIAQTVWCVVSDVGFDCDLWLDDLVQEDDDYKTFLFPRIARRPVDEDEVDDAEEGEQEEDGDGSYGHSDNDFLSEISSETDDLETQISDAEMDLAAMEQTRLAEVYDRETVLDMYRASLQRRVDSDEPWDGETTTTGDGSANGTTDSACSSC